MNNMRALDEAGWVIASPLNPRQNQPTNVALTDQKPEVDLELAAALKRVIDTFRTVRRLHAEGRSDLNEPVKHLMKAVAAFHEKCLAAAGVLAINQAESR